MMKVTLQEARHIARQVSEEIEKRLEEERKLEALFLDLLWHQEPLGKKFTSVIDEHYYNLIVKT